MKKSLIALAAMSAVAGAAQAQSSVTIYGILDSGYLSTESDVATYSATSNTFKAEQQERKGISSSASSSSRFGVRGTEDLGGGLRAEFVFETNLNATDATVSNMGNRQAFIGVNGGFGTVRVGTQYTAHHLLAGAISPSTVRVNMAGDLNYSQGQTTGALTNLGITGADGNLTATSTVASANTAILAAKLGVAADGTYSGTIVNGMVVTNALDSNGTALTTVIGTVAANYINARIGAAATASLNTRLSLANSAGYTVRRNNTVSYASPVMNGFQLGLGYNAPTTDKTIGGNETKASSESISLSYTAGKLVAGAAYSSGKSTTFTKAGSDVAAGLSTSTLLTIQADNTANAFDASSAAASSAKVVGASAKTVEVKGSETMAGVAYDLGVARLGYIYSTKKAKDTTSDLIDRKSHSFNVIAPLGAKVTAWANYADGEQDVLVTNKYDLKAVQLGARYNFSKRTDVYAIYGQTKIDNKASSGIDLKDTQYSLGVRHQF